MISFTIVGLWKNGVFDSQKVSSSALGFSSQPACVFWDSSEEKCIPPSVGLKHDLHIM